MECCNVGVLECWSNGVMPVAGCKMWDEIGILHRAAYQHSITPLLQYSTPTLTPHSPSPTHLK